MKDQPLAALLAGAWLPFLTIWKKPALKPIPGHPSTGLVMPVPLTFPNGGIGLGLAGTM